MKMIASTTSSAPESLALPPELYWDGKTEPNSPLLIELFSMTEPAGFWLNDDGNFDKVVSDEDVKFKPEMELISGDVLVFEPCDYKDEWAENKPSLLDVDSVVAHPNFVTKVTNSFDLDALKPDSFETVVLTTLTPPQSPPQPRVPKSASLLHNGPTESLVGFKNVSQHQLLPSAPAILSPVPTLLTTAAAAPISPTAAQNINFAPFYGSTSFTPSEVTQTDDDKRNSQIVDEFLKSCIKELPNLNDDCESMSWSSSSTSSRQNSIETDEDWSPFSSSVNSSPIHNCNEDNAQSMLKKVSGTKNRKGTRSYCRGIEDRKIRKKEQNKNAATRYRQKKKVEMENVLNEEQQLTQRNEELKRVLAERQREAKYLKTLIKEFYKKKVGLH